MCSSQGNIFRGDKNTKILFWKSPILIDNWTSWSRIFWIKNQEIWISIGPFMLICTFWWNGECMLLFWLRCKIKFRLVKVKQCSTGGMFSLTGGGRPRNPPQVLKPPPCHHPPKCPHEASPTHHHVHQPNHNQPSTNNRSPRFYQPTINQSTQ